MAKVLGIGNSVLDIILSTDTYPKEDQEVRAQARRFEVGGNVANSLYVLNQLGHQTSLVSSVGGDPHAKMLLKELKKRNIDTTHLQRYLQGHTPASYVVQSLETGSRTITHFRDLPEITFEHFAKIEIEQWDWLHFEGRNMPHLPGMLNIARTFLTHQPISLEVEKPRPEIESVFDQVDVIIFSHHYAQSQGFENGQACLAHWAEALKAQHLVCTWGAQGCWFKPAGEQTVQHQSAEMGVHAVDTLGAGDTFNAQLMDGLIRHQPLDQAVSQASQLAAHKCQKQGLDDLLSPVEKPQPLAHLNQISGAKATIVPAPGQAHSLILVREDDTVKAYVNNCPHQNVPLNEAYKVDINPFEKTMKCSVHDAFFNISDGECVAGPCLNQSLTPVAIRVDDSGEIFLA